MKKKIVVVGLGRNFMMLKNLLSKYYECVAFLDNDIEKQKSGFGGRHVYSVDMIGSFSFDYAVITPGNAEPLIAQVEKCGIDKSKIKTHENCFDNIYGELNVTIQLIGGLGDYLIARNWINSLCNKYNIGNNITIDICVKKTLYEIARSLYDGDKYVRNILIEEEEYFDYPYNYKCDLFIRFCIIPYIEYANFDKLRYSNIELTDYVLRLMQFGTQYCHSGYGEYGDTYKVIRNIFEMFPNKNYTNYCDLFDDLEISERYSYSLNIDVDENEYLKKCGLISHKYITINTGLNSQFTREKNTRCLGLNDWEELVGLIRKWHPEIVIVQVGTSISECDDIDVDVKLAGRTSNEEIKVILKHSFLHLDYDGGLVHLRHVLCSECSVVIFGSCQVNRHMYSENIAIRKSLCSIDCEWITPDWLSTCPKGKGKIDCMKALTAEYIYDVICPILDEYKKQ